MPIVNDATAYAAGVTPVKRVMAGTVEVWPQVLPATLSVTSDRWDRATAVWNNMGDMVEQYVLSRNGIPVYAGLDLTFTNTNLMPNTSYTWRIDAYKGGVVRSTATQVVATLARPAPVLSASATAWDEVSLSWTDSIKGSVDTYVLKRGSTTIYSGPNMSFTDTLRMDATTYSYTVTSKRGTTTIPPTSNTASATTLAYGDLDLWAAGASTSSINLGWSPLRGSADSFTLKKGVGTLYTGTGTSYTNTGLRENYTYSYTLYVKRSGSTIHSDTASAKTWDTATVSLHDGRQASWGWTGTTQKYLSAADFDPGVNGWCGYISFGAGGHQNVDEGGCEGCIGHIDPHINGHYMGGRDTKYNSRLYPNYSWEPVSTVPDPAKWVHPGANTCGYRTPSNTGYKTQWTSFDTNWSAHTSWSNITVYYYVSAERDDELRRQPYWDEVMAGRATHTNLIQGGGADGTGTVKAKVFDKYTAELLIDWESPAYGESAITWMPEYDVYVPVPAPVIGEV